MHSKESAMDRLPFEILSDIFLRAILHHFDLKSAPASAEFINGPLRISHVCRIWREIAVNDGRLWSHLTLGGWTGYRREIRKPIFDTWLARSKEAHLITGLCLIFRFKITTNSTTSYINWTASAPDAAVPSKLTFVGECLKKSAIVSCLNFLKAAIFLEEFTIYFDKVPSLPTSPSNDDCQFATGLRRLKLNYTRDILDNVNLPSLEVLSCDSYAEAKVGSEVLVDFFRRSRPPLTYLSLKRDSGHEDIVIPILRMLPTLNHLSAVTPMPKPRSDPRCLLTSSDAHGFL
ncbi:hypothetical protein A7U60_g6322 [Sanghuangporus baumii]|uniref:F-box domain-containing protein n=1 Tax=Sanghuangporus baumii TaxID=108892 RepID=A0A9Q5N7G0_SANBA|nr:hypothetical protein A7U60_g6322 [Sanghuangporus baumii]